jgi:hypothetical protein
MDILLQIAALATIALGLAYIAFPQKMYIFDLRHQNENLSELSRKGVWIYRLLGVVLLLIGIPRLF